MKTETKILGIILIITAALLFGGVFLLSKQQSTQSVQGASVVQIDYSKGQKIGSDSAKVKLVEFSDFQCPACAAVEPYLKKIKSSYSDVQIIYRHFLIHQLSSKAANLAEAAGAQGKFWEMHDKLFETQSQWSILADPIPFFLNLAKELNLDETKIKKALDENTYNAVIEGDIAEAGGLGVNGTPTLFLNGKKLNLQKFEDLDKLVIEELKR